MKNILFLFIILIVNGCQFEKKNNMDACKKFDELDTKILGLMDKIEVKHKGDRYFLEAFSMEQVYWIQYRDRRLRAIYPKKWDQHYRKNYGKEVFNSCKCKELLRLSERRVEDLQMYLMNGPADQQNCPSMLNK
tara:strand:+ start:268 stop:669 length:402 start_codon:yes stop_codon:yes gene_type:complete